MKISSQNLISTNFQHTHAGKGSLFVLVYFPKVAEREEIDLFYVRLLTLTTQQAQSATKTSNKFYLAYLDIVGSQS